MNLPIHSKIIVFTDLDSTLLDHDTYSFQAAEKALALIKDYEIPLIISTSKTMLEVQEIQEELQLNYPFIIENGGAVCFPETSPNEKVFLAPKVKYLGHRYMEIIELLSELKLLYEFDFMGFFDFSIEDVMEMTGLSKKNAYLAKQRMTSEPIKWYDTDKKFSEFKHLLQQHELSVVKGGRFFHVMGNFTKGTAMQYLLRQYQHNHKAPISIALGDSPNDAEMISNADYGIVIPSHTGTSMKLETGKDLRYAAKPGPEGWNEEMLILIKELMEETNG